MSKFEDLNRATRAGWMRLGEIDPLEWIGMFVAVCSVVFVLGLFLC